METAEGPQAKVEESSSEPRKKVRKRRNPCRADLLVAAARSLCNPSEETAKTDSLQQWQLEPPPEVSERRCAIIAQALADPQGPLAPLLPLLDEEKQWLMDTPCPEVLNMVHVKDVGGATKAAQQAAQQAAARPPRGPFRLASWRHVSTGELLQVPIPLSVFAKQGGAVWAKWRQRAWRGLYSLACQLGEVQEPAGCYDSGGQPLWDDLAEEDAALDKFPFCVPQKCRAQLLGLGTTERLKSRVLCKRASSEALPEVPAAPLPKKPRQAQKSACEGIKQRNGKQQGQTRQTPGSRGADAPAQAAAGAAAAECTDRLQGAAPVVSLTAEQQPLQQRAALQQQQQQAAQPSGHAVNQQMLKLKLKLRMQMAAPSGAQHRQVQAQHAERAAQQRQKQQRQAGSSAPQQQQRPLLMKASSQEQRSKAGSVVLAPCKAPKQSHSQPPQQRLHSQQQRQKQQQQPQQPQQALLPPPPPPQPQRKQQKLELLLQQQPPPQPLPPPPPPQLQQQKLELLLQQPSQPPPPEPLPPPPPRQRKQEKLKLLLQQPPQAPRLQPWLPPVQQPVLRGEDSMLPWQVATPARSSPTPSSCAPANSPAKTASGTDGSSSAQGSAGSAPAALRTQSGQMSGSTSPLQLRLPAGRVADVAITEAAHQAELDPALMDVPPALLPGADGPAGCPGGGVSWAPPEPKALHAPGLGFSQEGLGLSTPRHAGCPGGAELPLNTRAGASRWPSGSWVDECPYASPWAAPAPAATQPPSPDNTEHHAVHSCAAQHGSAWRVVAQRGPAMHGVAQRDSARHSAAQHSANLAAAAAHLPAQHRGADPEAHRAPEELPGLCTGQTAHGPAVAASAAAFTAGAAADGSAPHGAVLSWESLLALLPPKAAAPRPAPLPAAPVWQAPAAGLAATAALRALSPGLGCEPDALMSNEEFIAVLDELFG